VKNDIMQKIRSQKRSDTYAELAGKFSDIIYEQSDTLKIAANLVKMPVRQSSWLSKKQISLPIWTDKALQAVFSDDVVKNKRNSAVVEIAPNTLLAARLLGGDTAKIIAYSGTGNVAEAGAGNTGATTAWRKGRCGLET
jgi:peptidyl-prolyl cis-trans isomerase D